jgi:hypothetical protein
MTVTKLNWVFDRQIKELIGADDPGYTSMDAKVRMINASVTATLENLLGRCLTKNTYTEVIDSKLNAKHYYTLQGDISPGFAYEYKDVQYQLKNYPVDTNATFEVHYAPIGPIDGTTLLDPANYTLDAEKGILTILCLTGKFPKAIQINYTAGYSGSVDTDEDVTFDALADPPQEQALSYSIPADLVQAALWQAMHIYEKTQFSNINVRESRSQGSTTTSRYININAIAPEALGVIVQNKRRFFRVV